VVMTYSRLWSSKKPNRIVVVSGGGTGGRGC
jgi:hypothetical protein